MGRCVLKIFFFSSRLMLREILITKRRYIQCSDKMKSQGDSKFYLLKKKKEGWPERLFGVLLLLLQKIGLEISFSYELSTWCKILCVFSQWPHLSELEHHSQYLVYRLARRSWSAAHSCWLLEDSDHDPVKSRSQRLQVKNVKKCCGRKFDLYLILAWLVIAVQSHAI